MLKSLAFNLRVRFPWYVRTKWQNTLTQIRNDTKVDLIYVVILASSIVVLILCVYIVNAPQFNFGSMKENIVAGIIGMCVDAIIFICLLKAYEAKRTQNEIKKSKDILVKLLNIKSGTIRYIGRNNPKFHPALIRKCRSTLSTVHPLLMKSLEINEGHYYCHVSLIGHLEDIISSPDTATAIEHFQDYNSLMDLFITLDCSKTANTIRLVQEEESRIAFRRYKEKNQQSSPTSPFSAPVASPPAPAGTGGDAQGQGGAPI